MTTKQPKDKSHFILPDLGEGVHEAELVRWKVSSGDLVQEHQTLAEMETDKALVEVPSPWAGRVKELHGQPGQIITVGSVLVSYEIADAGSGKPPEPATTLETADAGTVVGSVKEGLRVSDRFRRGAGGKQTAAAPAKALATPAVRRVARELGIDINLVPGTGRGSRVTAGDIYAFAGRSPTTTAVGEPQPATIPETVDGTARSIPFRGIRRKIAEALDHSIKTAVHFTVTDEADVTRLDQKRREYAAVLGRKLSFLPFVMTAACRALKQHPMVNANVDDAKQEILIREMINLGCAVDTEHGLMVPVIFGADKYSIAGLDDAVADMAERCRNRTIGREELMGGTFSISNVGSFGGMFATPIINYPEVAILAVGRVKEQVLVSEGKFYAGKVMPLSLSCDHRVVDGAKGTRFLTSVVQHLEQPETLVESPT